MKKETPSGLTPPASSESSSLILHTSYFILRPSGAVGAEPVKHRKCARWKRWIAATALTHGPPLATGNVREFERVRRLLVVPV